MNPNAAFQSCNLFSSIPLQASGIAYHIDLAQNILEQSLRHGELTGELFANLIRATNGAVKHALQAWKLMALACSLRLPSQYAVLWLLRRHLERKKAIG